MVGQPDEELGPGRALEAAAKVEASVVVADEAHLRLMLAELLDERLDAAVERIVQQFLKIVRHHEPDPATEQMITERELATMLHCDQRTVRRLEQAGVLPAAIRFGGSKRWRLQQVSEWISALQEKQEPSRRIG